MAIKSTNLTKIEHAVTRGERWLSNGHCGGVLWFTGLSGSGKSTLAFQLERRLFDMGYKVFVLDGDNVRHGLNSDLGFKPEDREENIRRIGEVAALFATAGLVILTAFISPYRRDRDMARKASGVGFHEVFVDAPLEVCEARDPKGLYRKARAGEIPEFTGVSAPYEAPEHPELVVDTGELTVDQSLDILEEYIRRHFAGPNQAGKAGTAGE